MIMVGMIYCRLSNQGSHDFYLCASRKTYYLFSQKYKKSVHLFYSDGVLLNDALDFGKSRRDNAIVRTMRKLPMYIRYVEKEHDLAVLNKTQKQYVSTINRKLLITRVA